MHPVAHFQSHNISPLVRYASDVLPETTCPTTSVHVKPLATLASPSPSECELPRNEHTSAQLCGNPPLLINAHQLSSTTCVHMPLSRAASVAEAAIRNFNLSWVLRKVFRALNPQNQIPNLKP